MKKTFTLLFFLISTISLFAQGYNCGASIVNEKLHQDPALNFKMQQIEKQTLKYLNNRSLTKSTDEVYTIPVVVHVMHLGENMGEGSNISVAQVEEGLKHLNDAFRNVGDFASNPQFTNAGIPSSDIKIEFCLAKQDPEGNPTTGINRVETPLSNLDFSVQSNETQLKGLSYWDSKDYVNVWLVNEICYGSNCFVSGYAYFATAHGMAIDGIVNEASLWGSTPSNSKVHIHEFGHYFNLYHTFYENGDTCTSETDCQTGGDRVCDTPPDNSSDPVDCTNNATANTCTNDASIANSAFSSDVQDMYENYMDYGYQLCQNTFTPGQKDRMRAALTGPRASLLASQGCVAASTAPVPDFDSGNKNVCSGLETIFTDLTAGEVTSWNWSFPGGTPSTSTEQNPTVVYENTGQYDVTLTTTNSFGSNTITKENHINVVKISRNSIPSLTNNSTSTNYYIGIQNVTLEEINNTTEVTTPGGTAYQDYACSQFTNLQLGQEYSITITAGRADFTENIIAWIDYNGDGNLTDDEKVFNLVIVDNSNTSAAGTPITQTFTTPTSTGALNRDTGILRNASTPIVNERILLRVSSEVYAFSPQATSTQYGQIEDYAVILRDGPLPIEWVDFGITPKNKELELNWKTQNEINNSIFHVERMLPGGDFEKIGEVSPVLEQKSINEYSFVDANVTEGITYAYRIKQIDLDGAVSYSAIQTAALVSSVSSFVVYPNPSNGSFYIKGIDFDNVKSISILNYLGQEVDAQVQSFDSSLRLDIEDTGIYILSITKTDGSVMNQKIIKR